ncbi:hypothetical protein, partial [Pseudomonas aeruginosa]
HSVRNIRNIKFHKKNIHKNQVVTSKNLFRHYRNKPEPTGTSLFPDVPEMFRFQEIAEIDSSPRAMRVPEDMEKNVFRNVPPVPEHFQSAASPERRGLQTLHPTSVPDVPDVAGACAGFSFFAP